MADANLQQTCDRLSRVLMERSDTLIDYGLGRRLGERAGWSADAVELHDARFAAYLSTLTDGDTLASSVPGSTGCDALRRNVRLAFEHARHGELAYVNSQLLGLGLSDATMVERYRARPKPPTPTSTASTPR